jgi:hypothetical protein
MRSFCQICKRLTIVVTLLAALGSGGETLAATFFVNKSAAGASDANPGTASQPWLTILKGTQMARAGDTVIVSPGRYEERITLTQYSGTSSTPIVYQAATNAVQGGVNTSMRGFMLKGISNVVVRGFEVTDIKAGNRGGFLLRTLQDCVIEKNYITELHPDMWFGGGIVSDQNDCKRLIIRSNVLYKVEGVGISCQGDGWWVEANDVSRGRNCQTADTNSLVIENDADASRIFGVNHVFTNNFFHDYFYSDCHPLAEGQGNPHMDAIMSFSSGVGVLCSNNLVIGNLLKNIDDQMFITSDFQNTEKLIKSFSFRNNIFWNAGGQGLGPGAGYYVNMYDSANMVFENNLFIRFGQDSRGTNYNSHPMRAQDSGRGKGGCAGLMVRNNIFFGFGTGDGLDVDTQSQVGTVIDYNLWQVNPVFPAVSSGQNTHSLMGVDPKFMNIAAGDFHLQATSPAIGKGLALGSGFFDRDGKLRPATGAWTIGPYEFGVAAEASSAPRAPSNLRISQ